MMKIPTVFSVRFSAALPASRANEETTPTDFPLSSSDQAKAVQNLQWAQGIMHQIKALEQKRRDDLTLAKDLLPKIQQYTYGEVLYGKGQGIPLSQIILAIGDLDWDTYQPLDETFTSKFPVIQQTLERQYAAQKKPAWHVIQNGQLLSRLREQVKVPLRLAFSELTQTPEFRLIKGFISAHSESPLPYEPYYKEHGVYYDMDGNTLEKKDSWWVRKNGHLSDLGRAIYHELKGSPEKAEAFYLIDVPGRIKKLF